MQHLGTSSSGILGLEMSTVSVSSTGVPLEFSRRAGEEGGMRVLPSLPVFSHSLLHRLAWRAQSVLSISDCWDLTKTVKTSRIWLFGSRAGGGGETIECWRSAVCDLGVRHH